MPYTTEKLALKNPILERRTKLIPCQREMVRWWYENKDISISGIARLFKVNKRTIQFILFPERQKRNVELRNERGGTKAYYLKEKHREYMKTHRRYKHQVLKDTV